MSDIRWMVWRLAWTRWDDFATEMTFQAGGAPQVVARARRVFLGLWWFSMLPKGGGR